MGAFPFISYKISSPIIVILITLPLLYGQSLGPCPTLPDFPSSSSFSIQSFSTYSGETVVQFAYVVHPKNAQEVVTLANWALTAGYRVRAVGSRHSWAPLVFAPINDREACPKFLLLDTIRHLNGVRVNKEESSGLHSVTVGPGLKLGQLLEHLETHGLGVYASPTVGGISVGGMLTIGAHGSGAPSPNDRKSVGHTYGTLSNLVIEMTIVAWDPETYSYKLKTIHRGDPEAKAFLVSLGRTFITSVTLRVGKDQMLRSQSHFFIPAKELFGPPKAQLNKSPEGLKIGSRSLSTFVDLYGRVIAIGMSTGPESLLWVFTWKAEEVKPTSSRRVEGPYNYYFMNWMPSTILDPLLKPLVKYVPSRWSFISLFSYPFIVSGVALSLSTDYWGPSKNHLLYLSKYTLRQRSNSFTVLTSRENLQEVVFVLRSHYDRVAKEFEAKFLYPTAGEFNVRVSGVDDPGDVLIEGAEPPSLSNAKGIEGYSYDIVVWFEFSAYKETKMLEAFCTALQSAYYKDIQGKGLGVLRVEWPKTWAHTTGGPWTNDTVMGSLPTSFSLKEWNFAVSMFDKYDPNKIFSNEFLDRFLTLR